MPSTTPSERPRALLKPQGASPFARPRQREPVAEARERLVEQAGHARPLVGAFHDPLGDTGNNPPAVPEASRGQTAAPCRERLPHSCPAVPPRRPSARGEQVKLFQRHKGKG